MNKFFSLVCLLCILILPLTIFHVSQGHVVDCPIIQAMSGGCIGNPSTPQGAVGYVHIAGQLFAGIVAAYVIFHAISGIRIRASLPVDPPEKLSRDQFYTHHQAISRHLYSVLDRWLATGIYNQRDNHAIA